MSASTAGRAGGRGAVHVCLLTPALFGPLNAAGVDADGRAALLGGLSLTPLEDMLCKADARVQPVPGKGIEALLATVFGLPPEIAACCPVAALSRQMDVGDASAQVWLRADPVHVRAAIAAATLLHHTGPAPGLHLRDDEARALLARVNAELAAYSLVLEAPHPGRWYLRLPEMPDARFVSPYELAGGSLRDRLPSGPQGGHWRRVMNETQTALFECPTNNDRERAGAPVVNSLWLFGAGRLPPPVAASFAHAWSGHELALSLAGHAAIPASPLPENGREWLASTPGGGEHLLYIDACHEAVCVSDAGAWCAAVQTLQDDWLTPLVAALREGRIASLRLVTDAGLSFGLTRGALRRFWRRRRGLATIAGLHAEDEA